jgi:hypothetical protein
MPQTTLNAPVLESHALMFWIASLAADPLWNTQIVSHGEPVRDGHGRTNPRSAP